MPSLVDKLTHEVNFKFYNFLFNQLVITRNVHV